MVAVAINRVSLNVLVPIIVTGYDKRSVQHLIAAANARPTIAIATFHLQNP